MQPEGHADPRADPHPDADEDTNMDANQHGNARTNSDGNRYTYPADSYADARTYRITYANEFSHGGADLYTNSISHIHTVASSWPADQCAASGSSAGSAGT